MLNVLPLAFLWFFAIIGAIELFTKAYRSLYERDLKRLGKMTVVFGVKGRYESMEYALKKILMLTDELVTSDGHPEILIVNMGMDNDTATVCNMIEKDIPCIRVCTESEMHSIIEQKLI